jgi:hypothetical protein
MNSIPTTAPVRSTDGGDKLKENPYPLLSNPSSHRGTRTSVFQSFSLRTFPVLRILRGCPLTTNRNRSWKRFGFVTDLCGKNTTAADLVQG